MVYDNEAIIILELEITSLRISLHGDIQDEDARKANLKQLEALNEKRIHVIEH